MSLQIDGNHGGTPLAKVGNGKVEESVELVGVPDKEGIEKLSEQF